eukprot:3749360-Prorocentrum_lima.AAC.1
MDDAVLLDSLVGKWKGLWHAKNEDISSAFKLWLTHHAMTPGQTFSQEEVQEILKKFKKNTAVGRDGLVP